MADDNTAEEVRLADAQVPENAGDLGNGFRIRTDLLEPVPEEPVEHPEGRQFDVGGQPIHDPDFSHKAARKG
jgi:hypothetical protein